MCRGPSLRRRKWSFGFALAASVERTCISLTASCRIPNCRSFQGIKSSAKSLTRERKFEALQLGARVGIPWLGYTCGVCAYCRSGRENLCDQAQFTGYQIDGGYAEYARADHRFCFPLPDLASDVHMAPLMCGGLVGYRALGMTGEARNLGIYGFGAAAHIVVQVALHQGRRVFGFTARRRPGRTALCAGDGRCLGRRLEHAASGTPGRRHLVRSRRCPGADRAVGSPRGARWSAAASL